MPAYSQAQRDEWGDRAAAIGVLQAVAELGYPRSTTAVVRWADTYGLDLYDPDEEAETAAVDRLDDERLAAVLARLVQKIDDRLTLDLYVRTPDEGLKKQPLSGVELNALAAALEKAVQTHRLLSGEASTIVEQRHTLTPNRIRLLERSLAGSRARRAIVLEGKSQEIRA